MKKKDRVLEIYRILSSLSWNQSWRNLSRIDLNSMQFFRECSKPVLYRNIFVWKRERERKKKKFWYTVSKSFRGTTVSWISHEWQAWISNVCKFGTGSCQPSAERRSVREARRDIFHHRRSSNVFLFSLSPFPPVSLSSLSNPWRRLRANETKGNKNNNNNNNITTTGRKNAFST